MWVSVRLTFITFTTFTQLLVLIYPKFKLRNIDLMVWMKQVFYGFVNSVIFRSDLMTELTNDWKVDTWPCFSLETKTVPCTNLVFWQLLVISVTTKICKIIFTLVLYFYRNRVSLLTSDDGVDDDGVDEVACFFLCRKKHCS